MLAPVAPRTKGDTTPDWSALNISESGMFVAGRPLLWPGAEVDVQVVLPGSRGAELGIASRVQVVWIRDAIEASSARPPGMGMKFVDLDEQSRAALESYLSELEARYPGKQPGFPPEELGLAEIRLEDIIEEVSAPPRFSSPPLPAQRARAVPPPPPKADTDPVGDNAREPAANSDPALRALPGVGTRLGSYELLTRLGTGGMGDVYLAEHSLLGRRVALKLLHEQHARDRAALRRFFDEARLVNQIRHDNIVQITDLVVQDPHVFIVMELLEGRTLSDALVQGRGLGVAATAAIAVQLCSALDAVHRAGIVHRDLKPENIMLVRRGDRDDFVKLLDFGIAKLRGPADMRRTQAGQIVGTLGFMSPEQLLGKPIDQRADIYALGVVIFAMLTGTMPFKASSWPEMMLKQVNEEAPTVTQVTRQPFPAPLTTLVARCLSRDPAARPGAAGDLVPILRQYLAP